VLGRIRAGVLEQVAVDLLDDAGVDILGGCPQLKQVLVYPGAFLVERARPVGDGVVREQRRALAGESWIQGQVLLSWAEVVQGAAAPDDGRPWRASAKARRRWAAVMGAAFERLQHEPSTVIDAYGASDPAEFFAVATEAFFERPQALADEAPAVHAELAGLYGVDPLRW
jgi:Mlc titration factor MtfA (ptsG expression regulator)